MNSTSRCGRSLSSNEESSSTGAAETRRSFNAGFSLAEGTLGDVTTRAHLIYEPVYMSIASGGDTHAATSSSSIFHSPARPSYVNSQCKRKITKTKEHLLLEGRGACEKRYD